MAGGPFAANVQCPECGGVADRIYEGAEDDRYVCRACGASFGICWDRARELPTKLFDERPAPRPELADAQWREIDELIFARRIAEVVEALMRTGPCTLPAALDLFERRYAVLRAESPARFACTHEEYWKDAPR